MIRYLSLAEVLELHSRLAALSGGATGVRDLGALESAIAQPRATFEERDLYPGLNLQARYDLDVERENLGERLAKEVTVLDQHRSHAAA